jgi:hypothetical protein
MYMLKFPLYFGHHQSVLSYQLQSVRLFILILLKNDCRQFSTSSYIPLISTPLVVLNLTTLCFYFLTSSYLCQSENPRMEGQRVILGVRLDTHTYKQHFQMFGYTHVC